MRTALQEEVAAAYAGPKVVVRVPMGHVEQLPPEAAPAVREAAQELLPPPGE
ncbi:MAG TPA: hypothetical protein VK324_04295 [Tepidisphaeraceae bacterium]|nr:hypothetical protein [Tepidisphaeraceae bacterium]